mmetsp:Transcript_60946/g.108285  ORF Transcript_60946/g.108285 Transcript_60946/m.108285 type:complete len:81 (-) Transcript_60946:30-272(-)
MVLHLLTDLCDLGVLRPEEGDGVLVEPEPGTEFSSAQGAAIILQLPARAAYPPAQPPSLDISPPEPAKLPISHRIGGRHA